jgi:enoyl-CoA hydratase/carnithine racemase
MSAPLLERQDDDVRYLWLNRAERRNALDADLVAALDAAIADAMSDPRTSIVVIAGKGHSFCSGADLSHLHALASNGGDPLPYLASIARCFDRIEQAPKPVVASIHGHAVAGGLELALACDVIIAETGTLVGDGHARRGLLPAGGGSVRLPQKVGASLARWMLLTGELLPADTLQKAGLIHVVAAPDELANALNDVLRGLHGADARAQRNCKALLAQQATAEYAARFELERSMFAYNWSRNNLITHLAPFAADRPRSPDGKAPWTQPDTSAAS